LKWFSAEITTKQTLKTQKHPKNLVSDFIPTTTTDYWSTNVTHGPKRTQKLNKPSSEAFKF
jgi:hypothetical protein